MAELVRVTATVDPADAEAATAEACAALGTGCLEEEAVS